MKVKVSRTTSRCRIFFTSYESYVPLVRPVRFDNYQSSASNYQWWGSNRTAYMSSRYSAKTVLGMSSLIKRENGSLGWTLPWVILQRQQHQPGSKHWTTSVTLQPARTRQSTNTEGAQQSDWRTCCKEGPRTRLHPIWRYKMQENSPSRPFYLPWPYSQQRSVPGPWDRLNVRKSWWHNGKAS